MDRPTIEEERAELSAFSTLLKEYQGKATKYHRLANSIQLMMNVIENSIRERTSPKLDDHKAELEEKGE
jgi:hypothetical protein